MTESRRWIGLAVGLVAGAVFLFAALRAPWIGLAVPLSILGFLALVRVPGIGMGLLAFLTPLERMQRITSDDASFTISVMRFVGLACFAALVLARVHERRSLRLDASMFLYGLYTLVALAGLFYSTDIYATKRALGTILANCLFFFLFLNYFQERRQVHLMIAIWLAANLAGALYSTYDWHLGSGVGGEQNRIFIPRQELAPDQDTRTTKSRWVTVIGVTTDEQGGGSTGRRSTGLTSHPSVYGINLVMTIPFFFYLLRRHRKVWQQAGLGLALALIGYNILLTNTRAALVLAILTGGLCICFGLVKVRTPHVLAALFALVLLIPVVPQDIVNRVIKLSNYSIHSAATLKIRLRYWEAGLRVLQDHFLFGVGVGNEKVIPAYLENTQVRTAPVHNIYLQVALETGVIGWLSFFGFLGLLFYYARASARALRHRAGWEDEYHLLVAIQIAMLAVLIYGLQADVFNLPLKGWWLLAATAPVLYGWSRLTPRPLEPSATTIGDSLCPLPSR